MLQIAGTMGTEMCFQCAKTLQIIGTMGTEMRFQRATLQSASTMGTEMWRQCAKILQIAGIMGTKLCTHSCKTAQTEDSMFAQLWFLGCCTSL